MTIEYEAINRKSSITSPSQLLFVLIGVLFISFFFLSSVTLAAELEESEVDHSVTQDSINQEIQPVSDDSPENGEADANMDNPQFETSEEETYVENGSEDDDDEISEDESIELTDIEEEQVSDETTELEISEEPNLDSDKLLELQNEIGEETEDSGDKTKADLSSSDSESELKKGDSNERVKELKEKLAILGFVVSQNPNNNFGSLTEKKVKEFQAYYGLTASGIVDQYTWGKINQILNSPFQKGKEHEETIKLKKNLALLGFRVSSNPTKLYGSKTEQVVKNFQSAHNLVVSGIADDRTLTLIEDLVSKPLQKGIRREDVKTLKRDLKTIGFKVPGNGTNLFGTQTEKKVKEFQEYYGLTVDGIVDQKTLEKIEQILNSPFQSGKRHEDTIKLKKDLAFLGFKVSSNPTNLYGSKTEQVVKEFQAAHNLVVNGIADNRTLTLIEDLVSKPLQKGMRREDVKTLKKNLKVIGFRVPGNGTNLFGTQTEKKVKEFQKYYGLTASGIVDRKTQDKIVQILNSPFHNGKRHEDTIKLKKDLAFLGFKVSSNPTKLYGSKTEQVVKDFQAYYSLVVNGIADEVTIAKMESVLNSPFQKGKEHKDTIRLKNDLKIIGFHVSNNPTTLYGSKTKQIVKEFQTYYSLVVNGIADEVTIAKMESILNSPFRNGKRDSRTIQLKKDLEKIGFKVSNNPTNLYGSKTESVVKRFQKTYGLIVNGIADDVTMELINKKVKENKQKTIKIFIDAGHGGSDPGASSGGLREKDLTLYIAKKIQQYLGAYKNVVIKMSRTSDKTVSLEERTKMANDWGADFFFSVHINAGGGTGIESFIYNKNYTSEEVKLQNIIHSYIANGLKSDNVRDRGKKKENLHVLRESKMSAILFEYLFIDHKSDQKKLKKRSFLKKLARLTSDGIAKALNLRK